MKLYRVCKPLVAVTLAVMMLLGLAACSSSSSSSEEEVYRISVSIHDSSEVPKTQYLQAWADAVTEASGGRLEVTVYAGGTLAAGTEALDAVKNGTCSAAAVFSGFFTGQFPLSDITTMPLAGIDDAVLATNLLWDLYETTEELQEEYSEFKVIMIFTGANNILCTGDAVTSVSDLVGMKIRAASGTATDMMSRWGATPISMSSSELYTSMEKGVIDGYIIDFPGVNSWNLYEVTDSFTEFPFYTQSWSLIMNLDTYNSLPEDLQAIIDEYSGRDWSVGYAQVFEDEAAESKEAAIAYGCTVITLDEEALAGFQVEADAYIEEWIASITTDTFDGQAYYDRAMELAAQY